MPAAPCLPLRTNACKTGARFRAIILTSFTTFAGLYPLITLESTQAQFLIPMAVSLGYGVILTTFITLFLVPVSVLVVEDLKKLLLLAAPYSGDASGDKKPLSV